MSAPEGSQADQGNSAGPQERTQPGAGAGAGAEAGWMPWVQTWRTTAAFWGLFGGSLRPSPEVCGSSQAAQEPPSPGDSLPRAEPIPELSLPPRSPLGPRGSPCRQCSLGDSSTATPLCPPQGLSSSPRSEDRPNPMSPPQGLSSSPRRASSSHQDLPSSEEEEIFEDALEYLGEVPGERAEEVGVSRGGTEQQTRDRVTLQKIRRRLEDSCREVVLQGLLLLREIMAAPVTQDRAINIALLLGPKLPALFDDESSQVRELSISLFGEVIEAVKSRREREMTMLIRMILISLVLRMSDSTESVAEASGKTLLTAAKFLGWRKLKRQLKTKEMWRIGETLLKQDKLWLRHSLYSSQRKLRDAQNPRVRLEAVRFIGDAALRLNRDTDREMLEEARDVLLSLKNDPDASVESLAFLTFMDLRNWLEEESSGRSLPAGCCRIL